MALKESKYIWHDGKIVPWKEAKVHVLTHALHYGSSVFEGIRVYKSPKGSVAFRLTDHILRMKNSAKIYYMEIPYTVENLVSSCKEIVKKNNLLEGSYIRPIAYRGYGEMGVAGNHEEPATCSIAAWEWGSYLGDNGLEDGIDQLDGVADEDGEWTFDYGNSRITHQRADNSRYYWVYDKGEQTGDNATVGSLGNRQDL